MSKEQHIIDLGEAIFTKLKLHEKTDAEILQIIGYKNDDAIEKLKKENEALIKENNELKEYKIDFRKRSDDAIEKLMKENEELKKVQIKMYKQHEKTIKVCEENKLKYDKAIEELMKSDEEKIIELLKSESIIVDQKNEALSKIEGLMKDNESLKKENEEMEWQLKDMNDEIED